MHQTNLLKGISFIIIAELMFVSMAALIKLVSISVPNETIVFFRNFFVITILLPWVLHKGFANTIKTQCIHLHLLRSISGLGAMYCFFYALAHISLAEASLLSMTAPFFMPIIAFFWLDETILTKVIAAIIIGFLGIALILKPGFDNFSPVTLIALASGALAAVAKTSVRRLSFTESVVSIVFYFAIFSTLISAIPFGWNWHPISFNALILLFILTVFGTIGQLLMTHAYTLASSSQLGTISYIAVIFSGLYGWIFWHEVLENWFFAGTGLIVIAALLISHSHDSDKKGLSVVNAQIEEIAIPQIDNIKQQT